MSGATIDMETGNAAVAKAEDKTNALHHIVEKWHNSRLDRPKELFHEFLAEVLGSCVVILFGNGVCASMDMQKSHLKNDQSNDIFGANQYGNMGWGLGVCFGVLVSFESSGAHLNPAVTLTNMIFSNMSVKRGLVYMAGQFLGCFLGALLVTLNYVVFKGESSLSNFYCTSPYEGVSFSNAFFQEVLGTAILLAGIFAIASGNPPVNKFHIGGFVGALVFAIGNCMGSQTGYAINPARDFAPRLCWAIFYSAYGFHDINKVVFMDGYWLIPLIAPMLGGPLGALCYKTANHPERGVDIAPASNSDPKKFSTLQSQNTAMPEEGMSQASSSTTWE
eukprot:TRINITY_DN10816_c0_g1_i1.p1 TRINITY_DN10816_c0_g1~~TRINITY_DN10816_c0_g1_i1.p1  ORF type:complete len:334 (+),score=55.95 TRINITY_DN10816_c0_g1_i1:59-1060(+)